MRKKPLYLALLFVLSISLTACFKEVDKVFDEGTVVEFQQAIISTPAVGRTFPIISSANSVTNSPVVSTRLNLVGPQRSSDITVRVFVDTRPTLTTAQASSYTLVNGGNVVIPANTSFGSLSVAIGRATSSTATVANLVLVIDSTSSDFKPSQNYKRLGYSIRQ